MSGIGSYSLVGLDTNLFIYHFEGNPKFHPYTTSLFQNLEKGKLKAVTSVISVIESLSYPSPEEVLEGIKLGFETMVNLSVVEVDNAVALEAARIRREYGFRIPDAIQLATAVQAKAKAFITNDEQLKRFKEFKVLLLPQART